MTPSSTLHPLSQTFHRSWYYFENHLPQLLFAIALPAIVSLLIFWTGLGVTINQINQVVTFEDLTSIFSWGSPTTYMLFLMAIVLFCISLIGLIAGPLVMVQHDRIKTLEIIPRTLPYFAGYFRLVVLVTLAMVIMYVILYLSITIISGIAGFIQLSYLESTFAVLVSILPNVGLVMMAFFFLFAPFVLIEHNKGAYHALLTSVVLVRVHFWSLLLRLGIVMSCLLVVNFLLLFIPYVGYPLSFFLSTLVMTIYNYVLYEDVTGSSAWR